MEDCTCNWYCSCSVLLKGKRPDYLNLKEYQDFIKGPPPPEETKKQTSSWRTERRFGSAALGQDDDDEPLEKSVNPDSAAPSSCSQLQAKKRPYQTENEDDDLNKLEKKTTLVNNNHSPSCTVTSAETKLITNGIGTHKPDTDTAANPPTDDESSQKTTTSKNNSKDQVNGGKDTSTADTPTRSGYNCRNRSQFHKCSTCGKMFGQLTSLQMHEKEHVLENMKPHKCLDCGKLYATISSFERHRKTNHPKCLLCKRSLTIKEVENQPEEEIGINVVNLCKKCRMNDASPPAIKRRKSSSQATITDLKRGNGIITPPPPTTTTTTNNNGFGQHNHHEEPFEDYDNNNDDDDENVENDTSLTNGNGLYLEEEEGENAENTNNGQELQQDGLICCDYCGAIFDCSDDFQPHYQEHGKNEFECRYCLLPFSNSEEVCKHENSHCGKDRPWNCLFCQIKFRSQIEREFHERFHT